MIIEERRNVKAYSDGYETDRKALEIAAKYPEDMSQDIYNNSEYTVNSTFSSVRQNILNWYHFKAEAEILEVGAGMGSITSMLCENIVNWETDQRYDYIISIRVLGYVAFFNRRELF